MIGFIDKIVNKNIANNTSNINISKIKSNKKVKKIFYSIFKYSEKSDARYVGGCIRKILNHEEIDDIDIATNLKPNEVIDVFKRNNINYFESGIAHGTITANIEEKNFEITSLRKDISTDGRHAKVEFSDDWYEDAKRRDFTFNSIYADLDGNLYDPFDGKSDLKNGIVKFIGKPEERIKEDYLRILRYIRFFINYSKSKHSDSVKKIIKQNISGITKISSDRLLLELKKIVNSDFFLKIYSDTFCLEILQLVFPQLKNISVFNKLSDYAQTNFKFQDFIFLIALMIIDNTDNCEYFLYKYNISKENKKRIIFLNNIFSKKIENNFFTEKNLWKIFYLEGKNRVIDVINFAIFKSKKNENKLIKLKNFFQNQSMPVFPISAKLLMEKYNLEEGKELGQKLKKIKDFWIENGFKLTNKDVEKIMNT